jgi:cytochrome c oxidase cbb3-type subunit 3
MKYFKIIPLIGLMFIIQPAMAADEGMLSADLMNYIGYGAIVLMLMLFLVAMLLLLRTFKILSRIILKAQGYTEEQIVAELNPAKKEKKAKGETWNKLLSLRPMSEEKDLLMDHAYDDIEELDNPIPGWFMYLFYITIIFAVGYLLNYHVFHFSPLQYEEYRIEVADADAAKKIFLSKEANRVDETTVKLSTDPAMLADGKAIFMLNCKPCHGEHAQGVVGPNLTDDYWLHGNKINDLFKTIKYGVLAKGMPTWEKILSPKQIADVANYVKSLHGTNPAGAKEAQGVKETEDNNKIAVNIKQ